MLVIFRRHLADCKHRAKGRKYRHCSCPLHAEGTLRGRKVRKALDTKNWEVAQKLVRDWEIEGEEWVSVALREASERFVADMVTRELSDVTVAKSKLLLDELFDRFGDIRIREITTDDIAKFREKWKAKPTTAIKRLERLRSFFRFCISRKWIEDNPATGIKPPKERAIPKKPFEQWEIEQIEWGLPLFSTKGIYRAETPERLKAFVLTLRWTGLRVRDVVQLKRGAVKNGFITLRTQKNNKAVKLPLHKDVLESLENLSENGEYFFWSGVGNPKSCVGDWQRSLRRLSDISGVHVHAHRFRHTFATDLLSKGVPVSEVAAILGNSPRILEKHYSQWISSRQEALNAAVRLTWEKTVLLE